MSKKNLNVNEFLNIRLVLDRSGSMASCRDITINSINTFIEDVSKNYLKTFGKNLTPIKVNIGNGLTYKKIK